MPREAFTGRQRWKPGDVQALDDCMLEQLGVADGSQVQEERSGSKFLLNHACRRQRLPRFSDAGRPRKCQGPYIGPAQQLHDCRDLAVAADQRSGWRKAIW